MSDSNKQLALNGKLFYTIHKEITNEELTCSKVEKCIKNGAQIDAQDKNANGNTALYIAVEKNCPKMIELLLKHGANMGIPNKDGETPFGLAKKLGNTTIIELLQKKTLGPNRAIKRKLPQNDSGEPSNVAPLVKKSASSHTSKRKLPQDDSKELSNVAPLVKKSKIEEQGQKIDSEDEDSSTRGLKSTLHGIVYQLKLSLLFIKRALSKKYSFELEAEKNSAEKFDDLVISYKKDNSNIIRFLQAKHKNKKNENKKIKYSDLSTDHWKKEFCLKKYFHSYRKIKQKPEFNGCELKDFILCTNIDFDFEDLKKNGIKTKKITEPDDFLDVKPEKECSRYKLSINNNHELIRKLKKTSDLYVLAKELVDTVINDTKIGLLSGIYNSYHVALKNDNVIDIKRNKIHEDFIKDDRNLTKETKKLRELFFEEFKKLNEDKSLTDSNLWEEISKKTLDLSQSFGNPKRGKIKSTKLEDDEIKDSEISEFFSKLVFAVNQPNEVELEHIISEELGEEFKLLDADFVTKNLLEKVLGWMKEKGKELTKEKAESFIDEIKEKISKLVLIGSTSEYCKKLQETGIIFNRIPEELTNFLTTETKQIFNYVSKQSTKILAIKVDQAMQKIGTYEKQDSFIFINSSSLQRLQKSVLEAFNSTKSNDLLIIECKTSKTIPSEEPGLINQFLAILNKKHNKKIILLTNRKFEIDNQYENKLEQVVDMTDFSQFTSETQTRLLSRNILFQNQPISFNRLINSETAIELIDIETILKLVHKEEIKIGNDLNIDTEFLDNYYIERKFNRYIGVSTRIFQDKKFQEEGRKIIFVIEGIRKETLLGFGIKEGQICIADHYDDRKTSHFFIVENQEAEKHFEKLCQQFKNYKIHHLFWEDYENLVWKKSHGSISDLLPYVQSNLNYKKDSYSEEQYLQQKLLNREYVDENFLIISDKAGMGKTTILSNLLLKINELNPKIWLIRVDLNNFSKIFDKYQGFNDGIEFFLNTLLEHNEKTKLKTDFEKQLFRHFYSQGRSILMFDGFDEVSIYRKMVLDLLKALKHTSSKLVITTRSIFRPELEKDLGVFSYTLEPFSLNNQAKFLINYWTENLRLINLNQEILESYSKSLINKFSLSTNGSKKEIFTGIPLHIKMIAEYFQDKVKEFNELDLASEECQKILDPILPDLFDLYERFTLKKIVSVHLTGKAILPDPTKQDAKMMEVIYYEFSKQVYMYLAVQTLLSYEDTSSLSNEIRTLQCKIDDGLNKIKNNELNQGIVDRIIEGRAHFVHLTFAEYFASSYFITQMFSVFPVPDTIFKSINHMILNTSSVFIYCLTKLLLKEKMLELEYLLQGKTLANYMIQSEYFNIANVLIQYNYEDFPKRDLFDKTPLHYLAENGHLIALPFLLDLYDDIHEKDILEHGNFKDSSYANSKLVNFVNRKDKYGKTAAYYAAKIGCEQESISHREIACSLLLKGADINEIKEYGQDLTLFVTTQTHSAYANQEHRFRPIGMVVGLLPLG